ncbi:Probable ascorbate-specific transmembrane electron transporter [Seminavis robusta]|uniref:Probable ascorbate-specific transmembrane electron transporter n=1 Tax=Seminavis robusta TaxID=568900 RepID=A0A9N8HJC2_9STRA|nr:Probable ascorbate-specific transmembrane electron transporter [Seminavis robusta]|eukprot:Sro850_g210680.1 Probable ascorbate-specific transmembrane electron transporter (332) ;mRNA; f:22731-23726
MGVRAHSARKGSEIRKREAFSYHYQGEGTQRRAHIEMSSAPPNDSNHSSYGSGNGGSGAQDTEGLPLTDQEQEDPESEEFGTPNVDRALREWRQELARWQTMASLLAHALALIMSLLVLWWVHLLGGLAWSAGKAKQVFLWHPLLMILAYAFMTVAALSFRFPYQSSSRRIVKLVHGSSWAVAAIFGCIALIAVFRSHNDAKSGFIANLYSFHSWLGLGVVGLYVLQFLAGFFAFWWNVPQFSAVTKAKILAVHAYLGPFLHMAVAATILLGIQEKEGFVGCGYKVDKADLFPLAHLGLIPHPCLVSHALGIAVFATALCTSFALHNFGTS